MIVISDTTAITNLHQIKMLILVKQLYGKIIIPAKVYEELSRFGNQKQIVDAADWIHIQEVKNKVLLAEITEILDAGEAEAITLAIESKSHLLIMDEQKGRIVAKAYGLNIIGILGVILSAKKKGLIPAVKPYVDSLIQDAGFHIHGKLYDYVLESAEEASDR